MDEEIEALLNALDDIVIARRQMLDSPFEMLPNVHYQQARASFRKALDEIILHHIDDALKHVDAALEDVVYKE